MKMKMRKHHPSRNSFPHYRRPYPNAADPNYFIDRLVDGLLAAATGMGSITIFFFLITM